jgi:Na+-translocating ferredoxin:NAD+ oxidoreductase subunit B
MKPLATKTDDVYRLLQQHLDKQAVGFPATDSGADIAFLKYLFTPDEARVALCLSDQPLAQDDVIGRALGDFPADRTTSLLESAFQKGAIGWKIKNGIPYWFAMPVVIGMYEAQGGTPSPEFLAVAGPYMRTQEYGRAFVSVKPPQMRTIPINKSVTVDHHIATYDEVRSLVKDSAGPFVALACICREGRRVQGKTCTQTSRLETCLGMGDMAAMALRRNHGRTISADEAIDMLRQNEDDGLVLQPANEQNAEFICSCCGCCCGMLGVQKKLPRPLDFWTSNFFAEIAGKRCSQCGLCTTRCQVDAVSMDGPDGSARVKLDRCIGCGLCVSSCPENAITLHKKSIETVPPQDNESLYNEIKSNKARLP